MKTFVINSPPRVAGARVTCRRGDSDGRFKIAGGENGMKVCWQVTGTRKDRWAAANPAEVEQAKPEAERGRYLEPGLYDQPEEQGIPIGPLAERLQAAASSRSGGSRSNGSASTAGWKKRARTSRNCIAERISNRRHRPSPRSNAANRALPKSP
jgi:hypothetical protein